MSLPDINFDFINPHGGSKHRAFEELGFQLLTAGIDRDSWEVTRTGDPDAGLDWYATNTEGEVHGWQAKYIFDIDTLLSKMTDSVRTIINNRPNITEVTFVIPWNLPDGRPKRGKSARQKYNDRVSSWQSIDGAKNLRFHLIGESELLKILSQSEHSGRLHFFWDKQTLSHEHLIRLQEEATKVAGERYRPDLHVDLPIQKEIDALGLGSTFFSEIDEQLKTVTDTTEDLRSLLRDLRDTSEDDQNVIDLCHKVISEGKIWLTDTRTISKDIDRFRHLVEDTYETISSLLSKTEQDRRARQDKPPKVGQDRAEPRYSQDLTFWYRRIITPMTVLLNLLTSKRSNLIMGKPYFLMGDAGTGKTHLLLESCGHALQEHRPAVVLFGEQFGSGDLWSQLARGLHLTPELSQDELLGILDACGSLSGKRFLLIIDALNETTDPSFWSSNLILLVIALENYPHVSLVVSVRSTYIEGIDPKGRKEELFFVKNHPGLAGKEIEATELYFDHYNLELPRHPLLTPEFSNPLFLQLYCKSFQNRPDGQHKYENRIALFNLFIENSATQIARYLAEEGTRTEVLLLTEEAKIVFYTIIDSMIDQNCDRLSLYEAKTAALSSEIPSERAVKLLNRLEVEGIFATTLIGYSDSAQPGLRLTFQAFGDYIILNRRLERHDPEEPISGDSKFATWLLDSSWGIQEAAAVVLPERHGIELRDYLEPIARRTIDDKNKLDQQCDLFDRRTLSTLVFRSLASITTYTFDAVNRTLLYGETRIEDFYNQICIVAPIPNHPFNALRLHSYLSRMSMADRDATFGITVYGALDEVGPYWRLATWARNGPFSNYDEHVIELASIPLVWLLSSPNRFMRDWLTKILIRLFLGHVRALSRIAKLFATVNDDYIRERLLAIVYGVLMRSQDSIEHNREYLKELVIETCTSYLEKPIANALALDHLEGIVEYSLFYKIVKPDEIPNHKVPYGLPLPDYPWTMEYIDQNYDYKEDSGFPYGSFYISLFNMGDFGRYRVDRCFKKFSKTRRDKPAPPKGRYLGDQISYPTERARRWIFMKSIKYGWTPELFRQFERDLRHGSASHDTRKPERFGKKYQWIAYYELLARVRDNFHPHPSWGSDDFETNFGGLWQTFDRDIDPSVPPTHDFRALIERSKEKRPIFSQSEVAVSLEMLADHNLERYIEDSANDPLKDYNSLPKAVDVLEVLDQDGRAWLLLDAFSKNQVNDPDHQIGISLGPITMIFDQATIINARLVPQSQAQSTAEWSLESGTELRPYDDSIWIPQNEHADCCYVGEIGWRDQGCYSHQGDFTLTAGPKGITHRFIPVSEKYLWEAGRYDTSITDNVDLLAPSSWIISKGCLSWDGNLSWLDPDGRVVVTNAIRYEHDEPSGLIFLKSWFQSILRDHNLALLTRCWSERRDFRMRPSRPFLWSGSIALFDQSCSLVFTDRVNKSA